MLLLLVGGVAAVGLLIRPTAPSPAPLASQAQASPPLAPANELPPGGSTPSTARHSLQAQPSAGAPGSSILLQLEALGSADLRLEDLSRLLEPFGSSPSLLRQVVDGLASGRWVDREDELTPVERGALRASSLGLLLLRQHPDPSVAQSHPGVAALLLRSLPAWTEVQRNRWLELARGLEADGLRVLGSEQLPLIDELAKQSPSLCLSCWDPLRALALEEASLATAREILEGSLSKAPHTAHAALTTLFLGGQTEEALRLAEALLVQAEASPSPGPLRSAVLECVLARAPLERAVPWAEAQLQAKDVAALWTLGDRPGAQATLEARYAELLEARERTPAEHEPLGDRAPEERRELLVASLAQPRLLAAIAESDPSQRVRARALQGATARAQVEDLPRLLNVVERSLAASPDWRLTSDQAALCALNLARRARRAGSPALLHRARHLMEHLTESESLSPNLRQWLEAERVSR